MRNSREVNLKVITSAGSNIKVGKTREYLVPQGIASTLGYMIDENQISLLFLTRVDKFTCCIYT